MQLDLFQWETIELDEGCQNLGLLKFAEAGMTGKNIGGL